MQILLKFILTISISFYGVKLLMGNGEIKKSDLLMYIIKIGLVIYFSTGSAWQTMFFDGIYNTSSIFSSMVFKIQTSEIENKRDGCQFGNISLIDGTQVSVSRYPKGKEYLAIWDTLDCKIARYMGFGPEVSTANIAKLIIAGYFTGTVGIYLAVGLLFFGLLLIAATIRALHIFLSSCIAIIIMVYVSPIIFPLALFEKTKDIFKGWLKQIISFALQPMILFAYMAVFISVLDQTLIGSATFYGKADENPNRAISCKEYCQNAQGVKIINPTCGDKPGEKIVVPEADSIACMIRSGAFGNWPVLNWIGIDLPLLVDFFKKNVREKIITIAKAALVVYFLCSFMDEIPEITSQLLGGAALPGSKASGVAMTGTVLGYAKAIQQRAVRGSQKLLKNKGAGIRDGVKEIMKGGDKGKSQTPVELPKKASGPAAGSGGGNSGASP